MSDVNQKVSPADRIYYVQVEDVCGAAEMYLDGHELEQYNADPDAYAAGFFGLTKEQYLEWLNLQGTPLCAATTRKGKPCKSVIRGFQLPPKDWLALHRNEYCWVHGGAQP